MLKHKRCSVCGDPADLNETSAHFLEVHWLCTTHGRSFRGSPQFAAAKRAVTSADCLRAVGAWFELARNEDVERTPPLAA
jgi:hypothetical protein